MARRDLCVILGVVWLAATFVNLFLPNAVLAYVAAALASAPLALGIWQPRRLYALATICFEHRWLIALLVFCACVALRLHGSSIGMFDAVFPTKTGSFGSVLFGAPRAVRSDEYGVQTLTHFSQAYNAFGLYSDRMGLSATNMVLDLYSPAWDMTMWGKPLLWGYLLFGNEVGLSWIWCGQAILIFMCALEMCLVLSGGSRVCGLLGGLMIGFSPFTQWWFQPHMPIVILYAMALFCLGHAFFTTRSRWRKWVAALLGSMALTGFCLSFFPSFQVPCAYIVVTLLVACLVRDRASVHFSRCDIAPLVAMLLVTGGIVGRFVVTSADDFAVLLGTVYPSGRVTLGGAWKVADTFTSITSLFLPFKDVTQLNNSEVANSVHFAPFFAALLPRMLRDLSRDARGEAIVGRAFAAILFAQLWYMLVGVPRWFADATLLRYCARMHNVYGWTATLFSVWGLSVLLRRPHLLSPRERIAWPAAYVLVYLLMEDEVQRGYFAQFVVRGVVIGPAFYVAAACALGAVLLLAARGRRHLVAGLVGVGMLVVGATVNPLVTGTSAIWAHPISEQIQALAQDEPWSRWLCCGPMPFPVSNFAMANGARVLTATNFYPDVEKWQILDPSGSFSEQTNRYANQTAELVDGPIGIELRNADYIHICLNPQSLKDLGVRYLITSADYGELLGRARIERDVVFEQDGYAILRLRYEDGGQA